MIFYISVRQQVKEFYLFIYGEGKGGRKKGRETSKCERNIDWLPLAHPQPGT